jgi:hypothetical protein
MATQAFDPNERRKRYLEWIDNAVCVAVFFTAGAPAIVIMMLLSLPLLPLFGLSLLIGAQPPPRFPPSTKEVDVDHTSTQGKSDRPPGTPTPRYA